VIVVRSRPTVLHAAVFTQSAHRDLFSHTVVRCFTAGIPNLWYAKVFQVVREYLPFFHKILDSQLSTVVYVSGFVS